MTDALQGGREMPRGVAAEDMRVAVVALQYGILASLNEFDPFYRHELDIRTGAVRDQPWDIDLRGQVKAAYIQARGPVLGCFGSCPYPQSRQDYGRSPYPVG